MARPTPPPRELRYVSLSQIASDTTFRLRHPGDVSSLARSIAQAGQLFPIEVRTVGEGLQAITGFRRLAALRMLVRDRVLVRVHENLSDASAALIAAADALDASPLERADLLEMRERYRSMGWSTPAFEELVGRAIEKAHERLEDLAAELQGLPPPDRSVVDEDAIEDEEADGLAAAAPPPDEPPGPQPLAIPAAETTPRELSAEELADDVARRLSLLTQDLAHLVAHWERVPAGLRSLVADQIAYYRQLDDWIGQAGDRK